jgi:ribosomal protein L3
MRTILFIVIAGLAGTTWSYAGKQADAAAKDGKVRIMEIRTRVLLAKEQAALQVVKAAELQVAAVKKEAEQKIYQAKVWYQEALASKTAAEEKMNRLLKAGKDASTASKDWKEWKDWYEYVDDETDDIIETYTDLQQDADKELAKAKAYLAGIQKDLNKTKTKLVAAYEAARPPTAVAQVK